MRKLFFGIASGAFIVSAGVVAACGGGDSSTFEPPPVPDSGTTDPAPCLGCDASSGEGGANVVIESMRVEPADATINVAPGAKATQAFKVFAKIKGGIEEDITKRSVFYVPDNYLVGGFPADGSATFTTRLPAGSSDPPQRGGKLTVEASAANSDGSIVKVTTSLTVKLSPTTLTQPGASPALPANPGSKFAGTLDAGRAPRVVYPNDGTMLPPNLRRLDIHWDKGTGNDLFQLTFAGTNSTVTYYARCGGGAGYVANACGFELDQTGYAYIAASNNGANVKLTIKGTDDTGATYGQSQEITINLAQTDVEGGLYYWAVVPPDTGKVMRVDFGNPNSVPEGFVVPGTDGLANTGGFDKCVGCHALSRDGKKLVASRGGRWDGRLVYLNDLTKPKGGSGWFTQTGSETGLAAQNRVQFASFNPNGSQFVAVYGDIGNVGKDSWLPANQLIPPGSDVPASLDANSIFFHDGNTGARLTAKTLTFKPNHPDWSPDGKKIAMTHVGGSATVTQRPTRSGIDVMSETGGVWADPVSVVAGQDGKNRINPSFVPDSSFLLYTESTCAGDPDGEDCDGDADPTARTFAVKPAAGATPIELLKAAKPGVADGSATEVGDTFPRATPFKTKHNGGTLMWATVASRRAPGHKTKGGAQLLWMFAFDPAKILSGTDGSYPAFYLPFQDFSTSNHIGQWTEKIVGTTAPPPPPPPPPPPTPPIPR
ncbi:MAG: hypothetical protein JST00_11270 [Deltaproteobacteria bacterium]|nr:hypothetical protein [Deltaproteobacteria bacterium]